MLEKNRKRELRRSVTGSGFRLTYDHSSVNHPPRHYFKYNSVKFGMKYNHKMSDNAKLKWWSKVDDWNLSRQVITHSLTHLPTYLLTHSLTHSLTLTYSLTHVTRLVILL
jgi:hypothetical protein